MFKKSYSKINLILKVKNFDINYKKHNINTVIQLYKKIFDKIKIKKSNQFSVSYLFHGKYKINVKDCSITKAKNWFLKNFPNSFVNYKVIIKKYIPIGSGFGGESSNAAFFIDFLLKHNKIGHLSEEKLKDIAINVGSDVPFFLSKLKIAHVSELGNKIVNIKPIRCFIDIYPVNTECNTKLVYQQLDNDPNFHSHDNIKELYNNLLICNFDKNETYNDLQNYCFQIYPNIRNEFNLINKSDYSLVILNGAGSYLIIIRF